MSFVPLWCFRRPRGCLGVRLLAETRQIGAQQQKHAGLQGPASIEVLDHGSPEARVAWRGDSVDRFSSEGELQEIGLPTVAGQQIPFVLPAHDIRIRPQ